MADLVTGDHPKALRSQRSLPLAKAKDGFGRELVTVPAYNIKAWGLLKYISVRVQGESVVVCCVEQLQRDSEVPTVWDNIRRNDRVACPAPRHVEEEVVDLA